MRFFEVDSAVDAIMGAAMVAQGRASQQNKQGKLSMNGFLQMLANSGIMMDYDGFKTVFDTNPALQNVIAKFDKDTITFAGDSDDEGEGYEEPQTDVPDDERVAKMAKRAMRTREFVEDKLPPHLAKMFGKDGRQVDTRTDVLKQMRDIVANKQAMKVEFGDGKQMIDMYTASVLTQIYDKVNDNSKEAIIQRIGTIEKFNKLMPKLFGMLGEGIRKGRPATGKDRIPDPAMISLKKRIAKHVEDGLTKRHVVAAYPDYDPNDIAKLYDNEKALQDFEADAKARFGNIERKPSKKLSLTKERSLTSAEKDKMKHYEKKLPKQDFIDRYGKEKGEAIYYATATKMAKKNA